MLDQKGFDLWADGYDRSVGIGDEEDMHPFAGYKKVLAGIFRSVMEKPNATVLDISFGTGVLTAKLYEKGCNVYGQDFSPRMIERASEKMPKAHLYQGDFSLGLADGLKEQKYDFILSTYTLHHLTDERKISFLRELTGSLKSDGMLLIGDIAFETREELERCRLSAGEDWDDEEYFFVEEELKKEFEEAAFEKITFCAGIFSWKKPARP